MFIGATQDPAPSPPAFRALDFERALVAAQASSLPLAVDFFDPGSAEWKVMSKLTWGDPVVARWLEARVIAVQFDITRERELAARLKVTAGATCVLLTGEGLEIDRIKGFVDARTFMTEAGAIVKCASAVGPARTALDADPTNPIAHVDLGLAYLGCGRLARALEEVLWAWDNGHQRADFRQARLDELPLVFKRVLGVYPGGRQAVIDRRDALAAKLTAFEEGADWVQLAREVAALNTGLFAEKKHLALFDQLSARPSTPRAVLDALHNSLLTDMLVRERRWKQLLEGRGDVLLWLEGQCLAVRDIELALERGEGDGAGVSHEALRIRRNGVVYQTGIYVEALLATARAREAEEAIDLLLLHDRRAQAHHTLMRACIAGRRVQLATELLARAERAGASAEDLEPLRRTLAAAKPGAK